MPPATRGPLPPGVYWRRRAVVLSAAVLLVLAIGKVLGQGSDGSSDEKATQAGASTLATPTATITSDPSPKAGKGKGKGGKGKGGQGGQGSGGASGTVTPAPTPTPPPTPVLAEPSGPCPDDDVFVTPTVSSPVGGSDVTVMLNLQTRVTEACTFHFSPDTVRLDIVSGRDQIWLSRQCPDAVPVQDVVVRLATVAQVPVVWNARRSDDECSDRTAWALPGFYHLVSAVLGGETTDVQFELFAPTAATVTQTAAPQSSGAGNGGGKGKGKGRR